MKIINIICIVLIGFLFFSIAKTIKETRELRKVTEELHKDLYSLAELVDDSANLITQIADEVF